MPSIKKILLIAIAVLFQAAVIVLIVSFVVTGSIPFSLFPTAEASQQQTVLVEEDGHTEEYRSATIEPVTRRVLTAEEREYILNPTQDPEIEKQPTLDEILMSSYETRRAGEAVARAKAAEAAHIEEERRVAEEAEEAARRAAEERKQQQQRASADETNDSDEEIHQETINDEPTPMSDRASSLSPKTISFLDTELFYTDSYLVASAPKSGAGLWWGSDSTTDGDLGYFIGHNPGDFSDVMNLDLGDIASVCDRNGSTRSYAVVDAFTVSELTYLEDIIEQISGYGESICLQTCVGDGEHYRVVVAQAI